MANNKSLSEQIAAELEKQKKKKRKKKLDKKEVDKFKKAFGFDSN